MMKLADKYYNQFAYAKAIEAYKKVVEKKKKNKVATARLAECYRKTSNYKKASYWYKKAIDQNPKEHEYKFYYAQSLMSSGKYDDALKWFEIYQRKNPTDKRALRFIDWCNNIDTYLADSSMFKIVKLPFNSKSSEFGASFLNDGLVFASSRKEGGGNKKLDGWTGETYLDLFYVENNYANKWSSVEKLKGKTGTKYHEGPAVFSADGKTMYFTRNVNKSKKNKKKGTSIAVLKIFEAKWLGDKWGEAKEMPFNSNDGTYSVGHPAISYDGKFLFFTSDKPGGQGGKDIYFVQKIGDKWTKPKNLGAKVNTAGDEMFPTIHQDGTVYFSSDGLGGFGGLDIYSTTQSGTQWNTAQNIGYPINSPRDDFGLILEKDKKAGYFASNRKGTKGGDDIFKILINGQKAEELLVDKSFIQMPKNDEPVIVEKTKSSKNSKKDKNAEFSPTDESYTFVPKDEDVALGKVFYLIGVVMEYGKDFNMMPNAVVEIVNHTKGKKSVHYADNEGNFYVPLQMGDRYTVLHTSQGKVHDYKEVDTEATATSEVFYVVLRGKKPYKLQQYVAQQYIVKTATDPEPEIVRIKQTPTIKQQDYGNTIASTDNGIPVKNNSRSLSFKVQVGAFKKSLSTSASFFNKVDKSVSKEFSLEGLTRYVTGYFSDFNQAQAYSEKMQQLGYDEAFVAAYMNGRRLEIPAETAIMLMSE